MSTLWVFHWNIWGWPNVHVFLWSTDVNVGVHILSVINGTDTLMPRVGCHLEATGMVPTSTTRIPWPESRPLTKNQRSVHREKIALLINALWCEVFKVRFTKYRFQNTVCNYFRIRWDSFCRELIMAIKNWCDYIHASFRQCKPSVRVKGLMKNTYLETLKEKDDVYALCATDSSPK